MNKNFLPLLSVAATSVLVLALTSPAAAMEQEEIEGLVSSHISDVAPVARVVIGDSDGESFSATVGGTSVAVPLQDGPGQVDVEAHAYTDDGSVPVSATIELPHSFVDSTGAVASDGTVVYAGEPNGSGERDAVAVQVLENGSTRVQTVLASRDSMHEFAYSLDGFVPIRNDAGDFAFLGADGVFVPVEPAWAKDADGADVETYYEIRGNDLVQVVVPSEATVYPVVADPTWAWHNFAYGAKMNRAETRDIANAGGNVALCGLAIFANPALGGVCAALGGYLVGQASVANGAGECIFVVVVPAPSVWRYNDGDCY